MITPPRLNSGDRIAILSPASVVKPEYIDGAVRFFRSEGFEPLLMPHAKGPAFGSYAATDEERVQDLIDAYRDSSIRAILCARGGYGCNHLLERIDPDLILSNPKWLIGFSDISALHSLVLAAPQLTKKTDLTRHNDSLISLHSPMARHLSELPPYHYCTRALMRILTEGLPLEYEVPTHPLNRQGVAEGRLVGGNLAVINGLADTPYDPLRIPGPKILFIEDISEQIYAVERMLIRMLLSGRLKEVTGIICGHFTEYRADRNFPDMESMIAKTLKTSPQATGNQQPITGNHVPLALGFPSGHTDDNLPLPLGAHATLTVSPEITRVSFS